MIFLGLVIAINATLLIGMPIGHPARLPQLSTVLVGIAGVSTASPRVHGALMVVSCALTAISVVTIFLRASALTE